VPATSLTDQEKDWMIDVEKSQESLKGSPKS